MAGMEPQEISAKEAHDLWKMGAIKLLDDRGEDERRIAKIEGVPDSCLSDSI